MVRDVFNLCLGKRGKVSIPSQGLPFNRCRTEFLGPSTPWFPVVSLLKVRIKIACTIAF